MDNIRLNTCSVYNKNQTSPYRYTLANFIMPIWDEGEQKPCHFWIRQVWRYNSKVMCVMPYLMLYGELEDGTLFCVRCFETKYEVERALKEFAAIEVTMTSVPTALDCQINRLMRDVWDNNQKADEHHALHYSLVREEIEISIRKYQWIYQWVSSHNDWSMRWMDLIDLCSKEQDSQGLNFRCTFCEHYNIDPVTLTTPSHLRCPLLEYLPSSNTISWCNSCKWDKPSVYKDIVYAFNMKLRGECEIKILELLHKMESMIPQFKSACHIKELIEPVRFRNWETDVSFGTPPTNYK